MKPIKILFIFFSLFTINHSLFARDALPILVKEGEPFSSIDDFSLGYNSPIKAVAISKDEKTIVSSLDYFGFILIWNRATGALEQILGGYKDSVVNSVVISDDGKTIISASNDNSIKIWNRATGTLEKTLVGHKDVRFISISNDGKSIVSGSNNSVKIWNRATGVLEQTLKRDKDLSFLAISNDSKIILSSNDKIIKIWDRATGKTLEQIVNIPPIGSYVISNNGNIIILGLDDGSIKIWDRATGALIQTMEGYSNWESATTISEDGKTIISASTDNAIRIWNRATGVLEQILEGHKDRVNSVILSKDGKTIISGSDDHTIKIWNRATGVMEQTLDGYKLIKSISIKYRKPISREVFKDEGNEIIKSIAISKDGKTVVSSGSTIIIIWNRSTGASEKFLKEKGVSSVTISEDGKTIISGSNYGSIKIWNRATGVLEQTLKGHKDLVNSVVISKDGKTIISSSNDNTIKIWDRATGKLIKSSKIKKDREGFAIDSNYNIISYSKDWLKKSITFWNVSTGKRVTDLIGYKSFDKSMFISPDGKTITEWLGVYDIKTGKKLRGYNSGKNRTWVVFDYEKKKLYRGDDGMLLYKRDGTKLTLSLPKLPKKDNVRLRANNHIEMTNATAYRYEINIKNNSDNLLYWIKSSYHDKYCTIIEQRLSNLKANEEQNMTLTFNCSLPRENPKPIKDHKINLIFETATGSKFYLPLTVTINYAELKVAKTKVSEDGKFLNILLKNAGTEKLEKAQVALLQPFASDPQTISNIEANGTKEIAYPLATELEENATLSLNIYIPNEVYKNAVPLSEWNPTNITINFNKVAWYIYALWIFGAIAFIISALYFRRYKNPTVTKLAKKPKALLTLSESQLKESKQKLETINRLESTLKEAEVTQEQFEKTLKFYESKTEQQAQLFTQQIQAQECKKEGNFYRIKMHENFRLDALKSFLLYISDESISKIEKEVIALNDKVFVLAKEEEQNSVAKLSHDKTNRVIAPRVEELTELMLSFEPQDMFVKILSNCLLAKDVSPYQLNGDVKSESNFFGRVEILREIISNDEVNYLIVGARQLGKSSILKALERRYAKSAKVVCYSFTLDESGELLPSMVESLGLEKSATLEQIVLAIKEHEKRPIFLIDEADMFVKHEKECGYFITSVLRKLAQEGEATFVMAGFWTLYEYVTLDYQSPLKNFGKLITLGGLEEEACQQLMVEPMKRIGVSYESESLVEETVKRCGYRANYIATVCDVVLRKLEGSVIAQKDIDNALNDQAIDKVLKGWGSMSANKRENRLDRLIVYLTIEKESFRLGDVIAGLKEQGLNIDIEKVNESLDSLVLGYVLGKYKGDYRYQIPLLKERILEDDLEFLIEGEVEAF